ncbi:hypothetical protein [Paenibacillus larvae]|uniref:hypothetical protein n=1 Tax=Paenibacillus larvae TaxID=1464 RepID=UPI00288E7CDC|nr:hypothetical protein [Paenibacillus larvae]MDT2194165.1 hypothetical protein [Paenibacillus larvae]
MVIGSWFVEKSSYKGSVSRRIGIYYFYLLIRLLTGNKITDPTSGYRIVNRKIIKEFSQYYPIGLPGSRDFGQHGLQNTVSKKSVSR